MKAESEVAGLLRAASVDPEIFAREILGVDLNSAQRRFFRQIRPVNVWEWPRKLTVLCSGNQVGKTLALSILLVWAGTYKIGRDPADKKAWFERPYMIIHVAPKQLLAYHALKDIRLLIKGAHPAQRLKVRLPPGLVRETRVETYYDGIEFANGSMVQFRTTEDKAAAILGYKADLITYDEAGFDDYLQVVMAEVLWMRLIASGGPMIVSSTPNGLNDFYTLVDGIQSSGREIDDRVWVRDADDAVLVWAYVADNVGFGITQTELDRMEAGLPEATKEQQLRGAFLNPPEAFFVPTDAILRSFTASLPNEQRPKPAHRYIAFWDVSLASDPTVCIVLDVSRKPWIGVYFRRWEKPLEITALIGEMTRVHQDYNAAEDPYRLLPVSMCKTAWDATSMGGVAITQLVQGLHPKAALNFGGPDKKIKVLTNARAMLSKQDVLLPATWLQVRNEIVNYKLKDQKLVQDCVVALSGAIFCGEGVGDSSKSHPFSPHGRVTTWPRR